MAKTLTLSRKCKYRAKIFAGIVPLTPVDSSCSSREFAPLILLDFFPVHNILYIFHSPLIPPSFLIQHFNYSFQPAWVTSEVCNLLIEGIRWRPLG